MTTTATTAHDVESLLSWRLAVAGRLVRTLADAMAGETGAQSLGVLMRLGAQDGLTQAELARRQRVEAPTMCRMVDRLERDGLVVRERRTDDRRALRVTLTPAGREVADGGPAFAARLEERAFGALDATEREQLARLLDRVLEGLPEAGRE